MYPEVKKIPRAQKGCKQTFSNALWLMLGSSPRPCIFWSIFQTALVFARGTWVCQAVGFALHCQTPECPLVLPRPMGTSLRDHSMYYSLVQNLRMHPCCNVLLKLYLPSFQVQLKQFRIFSALSFFGSTVSSGPGMMLSP